MKPQPDYRIQQTLSAIFWLLALQCVFAEWVWFALPVLAAILGYISTTLSNPKDEE